MSHTKLAKGYPADVRCSLTTEQQTVCASSHLSSTAVSCFLWSSAMLGRLIHAPQSIRRFEDQVPSFLTQRAVMVVQAASNGNLQASGSRNTVLQCSRCRCSGGSRGGTVGCTCRA